MKATVEYHDGYATSVKTHEADRIDVSYDQEGLVVLRMRSDGVLIGRAVYPRFISVDQDLDTVVCKHGCR